MKFTVEHFKLVEEILKRATEIAEAKGFKNNEIQGIEFHDWDDFENPVVTVVLSIYSRGEYERETLEISLAELNDDIEKIKKEQRLKIEREKLAEENRRKEA
jgi:hypothetical protein